MDLATVLASGGLVTVLGGAYIGVSALLRQINTTSATKNGLKRIADAIEKPSPHMVPAAKYERDCNHITGRVEEAFLVFEAFEHLFFGRQLNRLELCVLADRATLTDAMVVSTGPGIETVRPDVAALLPFTKEGLVSHLLSLRDRLPVGGEAMAAAIDTRPPAHGLPAAGDDRQTNGRQHSSTPTALPTYSGGNTLPARTPAASLNGSDGTSGSLFTVSGEQRLAQTRQQLWERIYDGLNANNPRLDLDGLWRFYYTYLPEDEELWFHRPDNPGITHCEILERRFAPELGLTALPGMERFPDYMTCKRYEDWDKTRALIQDGV